MASSTTYEMESTIIADGDKMVAIPLTDKELSSYITDVEKLKTDSK